MVSERPVPAHGPHMTSNISTHSPAPTRVPAGTPSGGQFASVGRREGLVNLNTLNDVGSFSETPTGGLSEDVSVEIAIRAHMKAAEELLRARTEPRAFDVSYARGRAQVEAEAYVALSCPEVPATRLADEGAALCARIAHADDATMSLWARGGAIRLEPRTISDLECDELAAHFTRSAIAHRIAARTSLAEVDRESMAFHLAASREATAMAVKFFSRQAHHDAGETEALTVQVHQASLDNPGAAPHELYGSALDETGPLAWDDDIETP